MSLTKAQSTHSPKPSTGETTAQQVLAETSDAELLTWLATHSEKPHQADHALLVQLALEEIIHRHGSLVLGVCRRHLKNDQAHSTDDLFQLTFLALLQQAKKIRRKQSLASWLCGTAYRMALQWNRQAHRTSTCPIEDSPAMSTEPWKQIADQFDQQILDEELQQLPPRYRDILLQFYYSGHSHQQIANTFQITTSAVDGLLKRARKLLRKKLLRRGIGCAMGTLLLSWSSQAMASPAPALVAQTLQLTKAWGASAHMPMELNTVSNVSTLIDHSVKQTVSYGGSMMTTTLKSLTAAVLLTGGVLFLNEGFSTNPGPMSSGGNGLINTAYAYEQPEHDAIGAAVTTSAEQDSTEGYEPVASAKEDEDSKLIVIAYDLTQQKVTDNRGYEGQYSSYGGIDSSAQLAVQNALQKFAGDLENGQRWTYDTKYAVLRTTKANHEKFNELMKPRLKKRLDESYQFPYERDFEKRFASHEYGMESANGSPAESATPQVSDPFGSDSLATKSTMENGNSNSNKASDPFASSGSTTAQTTPKAQVPEHGDTAIRKLMTQEVDYSFVETPLVEVADYLSEQFDIPVIIDQVALDDLAMDKDYPLSLTIKGVTLKSALKLMLEPNELSYMIENEVLHITTRDRLFASYSTRVYSAEELGLDPEAAEKLIRNHIIMASEDEVEIIYCSQVGDVIVLRGNQMAHDLIEETFQKIASKSKRNDITVDEITEVPAPVYTGGGGLGGGGGGMGGGMGATSLQGGGFY